MGIDLVWICLLRQFGRVANRLPIRLDLLYSGRTTPSRSYKNIGSLFRASIDWALIERPFPDILRVVISIKAGLMTLSTILRRFGSMPVAP